MKVGSRISRNVKSDKLMWRKGCVIDRDQDNFIRSVANSNNTFMIFHKWDH